MPEARAAVPIELPPFKNVMVPVAADGETVAVNVMAVPTTGVEVDEESVTVSAVVPPELDGACQKSPQPAIPAATAIVSSINPVALPMEFSFTLSPFRCRCGGE